MNVNKGNCPGCQKPKAMRPVKEFGGRDWPGSMCRFCAYFIPDVQSKLYPLSCADCNETMGQKSLDYRYLDLDEETIQGIRAAEEQRAAVEKDALEKMSIAAKTIQSKEVREKVEKDIELRRATGLHEPRKLEHLKSWEKVHEEALKNHYCADCHRKRIEKGLAEDSEASIRHEVVCDFCGTPVAWLDVLENRPLEIHADRIKGSWLYCAGACTEKAAEIVREIRKARAAEGATS